MIWRILCAALAVLALSAAAASGAEAPSHPLIAKISGENIKKEEQFIDACGIAVDSQGDVYVADYYQHRIAIFNAAGRFLTQIAEEDPLDGPCGLAVDSAGDLYVNNWHRNVAKFTPSSFPPSSATTYGAGAAIDPEHLTDPTGVAVDPASGRVYVDDRTSVAVYEPSGAPVQEGGAAVRIGLGSLGDGYGVAVSGFAATAGYVYVADAADDTVKVYDPATDPGVPIALINGAGTPRAGFVDLADSDLAVDPSDGHLYVADDLQPHFEEPEAVVYEFSAANHYRGQIPNPKVEGEHSFLRDGEPSGIAVGSGGDVYVTSGTYEDAEVFVFGPAAAASTQVLAVTESGSGSGTVASNPAGLRCPGACEGEFNQGSTITLAATPGLHSAFAGWSGCDSEPSADSCVVGISAGRSVTAEFEAIPQQTLSVAKSGSGAGTISSSPAGISCGTSCEGGFDVGSEAILTATPDPHSAFAGWSGCDSEPSAETCVVGISADRSVTAEFEPVPEPPPLPLPVPTVSSPPVAVPAPSQSTGPLRLGRLTGKGATATLGVVVPAPGALSASGKGLRRPSALRLAAAGPATVHLRLSRAGRRALAKAKRQRLSVKVTVTFKPNDGGPIAIATKTVTFEAGRKHR